jgi:oligopeptide/dipeptide ABC transporter ATP-binding protein
MHPYTRALFSAIPNPDPELEREVIPIDGDVPSPLNPPSGCRFHTRCPLAMDICKVEEPKLKLINSNHKCACHLC